MKGKTLSVPGIKSLGELFADSVSQHKRRPCLGKRTKDGYSWRTYEQTGREIAAMGAAFAARGLAPQSRVGVYGPNAPEWMITMQACNRQGYYCVPLYDSLGETAVEFIIKHAEVTAVAVAGPKLAELAKALPNVASQVKTVVFWDDADRAAVEAVQALGVGVFGFDEFVKQGEAAEAVPPASVDGEDLCTIMYTSGTTGDPKGVMLTHRAVIATVLSLDAFLKSVDVALGEGDAILSFLPLAHIFDRAAEELMLYVGGSIGYWSGNVKGLLGDIAALRPTLFCSVPRVFDRIYSSVTGKVEGGGWLKRTMFHHAFKTKFGRLKRGVPQAKAGGIWDKIVFKKIKEALGGRCKIIVSGGAPLSAHVEEFLRVCMCSHVVQGYGLTETCAASFIAEPADIRQMGTVGPPQPAVTFCLEGVPEMKYSPGADPARGELLIRGPALFSGYYKDQEKTDEVVTKDGWFHTGDIAEITPAGAIRIIDRKKNIFKLAQGEYVAVEKLENTYKMSPAVEQIWVYGNSFESVLVAVVVPSEDKVKAHGGASAAQLASDAAFKKAVLDDLTAAAKADKLKGFEMIKGVIIEPELFSVENNLLTPTFKLKRPQLLDHYRTQIDALYESLKKK